MTTHDTRQGQNVNVRHNLRETFSYVITVTDQDDNAVDLSAKTITMSIRLQENSAALTTLSTTGGEIVVSGASNNVLTHTKDLSGDLTSRRYFYDIHNDTDDKCIQDGYFIVSYTGR